MKRLQSIGPIKYICAFAVILVVALITGTRSIENPGLYFDAVYPDYIGAIFAFPGVDNFYEICQCTFWPLLGNFYHGTVSAFLQFVVLKITGRATLAVFRITNVCLLATAVYIVFILLYKISKNYVTSIIVAALSVSTSNVFELTRTQYYVMLCGCIFMLISFCYTWKYFSSGNATDIVIAGIFQGLAFYGYFTFLFFAPVTIIMICVWRRKKCLNDSFLFGWSILLGSILYFWGYWDSALINFMGKNATQIAIFVVGCLGILLFFLSVPVVMCSERFEKIRKRFLAVIATICGMGVIGVGAVLFVFRDIVIGKLLAPLQTVSNMKGRNQGGVFIVFWKLLYRLISNKSGQELIFETDFFEIGLLWIGLFCVLNVVCLVHILGSHIRKKNIRGTVQNGLIEVNVYLLGYYFVSLVIIKRMQEQHLVIFYFLLFGSIGLCMAYLEEVIDVKTIRVMLIIGTVIGLGTNAFNCFKFTQMLDTVGGRSVYSTAINDFCFQAKNNTDKDNTVYIFPEWGLYSEFVYLTENSCLAIRDADISTDLLQSYLDRGMKVEITAFDEMNIKEICSELNYKKATNRSYESEMGETILVDYVIFNK